MFKRLAGILPISLQNSPELVPFLGLAASVALALVSIALSQIALAGTIVASISVWKQRKSRLFQFPFMVPLLAFFLWTVITALAAQDVRLGLTVVKKFYIFLILILVPLLARGRGRIQWIYHAIFAAALISSTAGLAQYFADPNRDLLHRISGFMSQWMTYSGLLMLALVALTAYIFCIGWRDHKWTLPLFIGILLPIIMSETRNAWLGSIAGIGALVVLKRPRALIGLLVILLGLYFVAPAGIKQRLQSGWDPDDPNTRNRIELVQTSMRLIRDHPWFGVGPNNVALEALQYRGDQSYPAWMYQHMHNNFLQIAAERGIPGILLWLWLMVRLAWDAISLYRRTESSSLPASGKNEMLMASAGALGAWVALLVAGMFEYNFGDSEVLTLFLFLMSTPYAFMHMEGQVVRNSNNSAETA